MIDLIWEQIGTIQHRALLNKEENLYVVVFEPICFLCPYEAQIRKGEINIIITTNLPDDVDNLNEAKNIAADCLSIALKKQIRYYANIDNDLSNVGIRV